MRERMGLSTKVSFEMSFKMSFKNTMITGAVGSRPIKSN